MSIRGWEIRSLGGMKSVRVELVFDPERGKTRIRLDRIRQDFHVNAVIVEHENAGDKAARAHLDVSLTQSHLVEFLDCVAGLPAVKEIREVPE